jgi:hypothetical protein
MTEETTPDERGVPKPNPQRPIVANPSTPGIQKPNKPDGRERPGPAPTERERSD